MKTGIYRIHNLVNGKSYIGKSERDIDRKFRQHIRGSNSNEHLQNAIKKYGIENFEFTVLEYCEPKDCCDRERYWIEYYDSMNPNYGYNKTGGGECASGFKMSKEATLKATKTRKEHFEQGLYEIKHTEESRQKLRDSWARRKANGYKMSDETRKKLSESKKGCKWREEQKEKVSQSMRGKNNHFYGKHHTEESRQKMAQRQQVDTIQKNQREK